MKSRAVNYLKGFHNRIKSAMLRWLGFFPEIDKRIISLNSYKELMRLFGWQKEPQIDATLTSSGKYPYVEAVNERALRDAEVIMAICRNANADTILEIGTAQGFTTAQMAENAPGATIYTVNIPPEEANKGEGGRYITEAFDYKEIGKYYKQKDITNVRQIFANTKKWQPEIGEIDIAYIDGCHDKEYVLNDTLKILPHITKNGFILWHDANPGFSKNFKWISEVCGAIESLCRKGHLPGRLFAVKDSWVLVWKNCQ